MSEEKPILLVVEDDLDVAEMLSAYFHVQGYEVHFVHWGQDALQFCVQTIPDLIILDIRLPDLDGYEVASRLRSHRRTKDVPILFLTEKRSRADRLHGLGLGADDYLTKPFDVQELRLRVRNAIKRAKQGTLTNPVTGLPEGVLVEEKIDDNLAGDCWEILFIGLQNMDEFRETYGFVASDDVLRAVTHIIKTAVEEKGSPIDFLGQLSPTGFLLITSNRDLSQLTDSISSRIQQSFDFFYPLKDRLPDKQASRRLSLRINNLSPKEGPFRSHKDVIRKLVEET